MGRYSRLHEIRRMDPARDYAEILRLISQYEFPWDYRQGVSVAFLRDYGVPRISLLLDRTQEFERAGQKRYDDTVLIGYEMAADGFDSERGRAAARHLNRIHGKYRIPNDDFRYVLATTVRGAEALDRPVRLASPVHPGGPGPGGGRPQDGGDDGHRGGARHLRGVRAAPRLLRGADVRVRPGEPAGRERHVPCDRELVSASVTAPGGEIRARAAGRAAAGGAGLPAAAAVGAGLGVGGPASARALCPQAAGPAAQVSRAPAAPFVPLRLAARRSRTALGPQPPRGTPARRDGRPRRWCYPAASSGTR